MLDRKGSFLVSSFCRLAKIYEFHGRPRTRVASALRSFYVIVVIITIATCKYYFLLPFHRVTNLLSQFFPPFFFLRLHQPRIGWLSLFSNSAETEPVWRRILPRNCTIESRLFFETRPYFIADLDEEASVFSFYYP